VKLTALGDLFLKLNKINERLLALLIFGPYTVWLFLILAVIMLGPFYFWLLKFLALLILALLIWPLLFWPLWHGILKDNRSIEMRRICLL